MDAPTGQGCTECFHEPTGKDKAGRVVAVLSDEREPDGQRDRPIEEPEAHHDRQDDPVVPIPELGLSDRGAVVEAAGGVDLGPSALEQRVVDGDGDRRIVCENKPHDKT